MAKRILYLCAAPLAAASACHTHVCGIADGLRDIGWIVDVISPPCRTSRGTTRRVLDALAVQIKAAGALRNHDVVYCRSHFLFWPIAAFLRAARIPVVQEVNGPYDDVFVAYPRAKLLRSVLTAAMRSQLRGADLIITVTQQLSDWVKKERPNGRVVAIQNGADTKLFRPDAQGGLNVGGRYVIFFGSLARWQGVDTLLRAVRHQAWPNDVRLAIVGDGTCREDVEHAAAGSEVVYLGSREQADVAGLVARSIASVIPKNNLGQRQSTGLSALKLYESMACAVPVVVTDIPGHGDFVRKHRCGLVIPVGDAAALARAVADLAGSDTLRLEMGSRGRDVALREASWACRAAETDRALGSVVTIASAVDRSSRAEAAV